MTEKRQNQQIQKQEEMKPAQPEAVWQEYDEDEISLGDLFHDLEGTGKDCRLYPRGGPRHPCHHRRCVFFRRRNTL